jgi:hypothetical protein
MLKLLLILHLLKRSPNNMRLQTIKNYKENLYKVSSKNNKYTLKENIVYN